MESIIETLYINLDRPQAPDDLESEKEEYLKMCEMLQAQYGPEFVDRMFTLENRILGCRGEEEFSFGFRACARLMLEALGL